METRTIGWVCDRATSKRRIRVAVVEPGGIELLMEVYDRQASCPQQAVRVELDGAGAEVLGHFLVEALLRCVPPLVAEEAP